MQICIYDKSYMYDMCIHVLVAICDVYMYIYVVYILNVYTDLCIQKNIGLYVTSRTNLRTSS